VFFGVKLQKTMSADSVKSDSAAASAAAAEVHSAGKDALRSTVGMSGDEGVPAAVVTPNPGGEGAMERAEQMNPECDGSGNVEYKLKLVRPSESRLEHLTTQMKWRIAEGGGEAIYELGVEDSGVPSGMSKEELNETLHSLKIMAGKLGASITLLRQRSGISGTVAEVLVRARESDAAIETRVAAIGNVDSGKSTLLGVLSHGGRDNGRGSARMLLFRHKHEMETGRTSSVGHETLCFDSHGKILSYKETDPLELPKKPAQTEDDALQAAENADALDQLLKKGAAGVESSDAPSVSSDDDDELESFLAEGPMVSGSSATAAAAKIVSFIDLAGHEKYLKTTLFGMTCHQPDYAMLIVGSNMGLVGMTKEHLGITLALKVPVFVVVTKIDMCPENVMKDTLVQLKRMLKSPGCRKVPVVVRNMDDVVVCARNIATQRIAPIFCCSSVTGESLALLRRFLNLLPSAKNWDELSKQPLLYSVDGKFNVPGVGTVLSGTVLQGSIRSNDTVLLGPDRNGVFVNVALKGMRTNDVKTDHVRAGQSATLALRNVPSTYIRTGMVVLDRGAQPVVCYEFQAEVLVLYHSTTISVGYESVVHCSNVNQTARVVAMDKEVLRTGDKAVVTFRFLFSPEYLLVGRRVIFRENRARGIGRILSVTPYVPTAANRASSQEMLNGTVRKVRGGRGKKSAGGARKNRSVVTSPPPPAIDPETGKRKVQVLRRSGEVNVGDAANMVEINGVSYVAVGSNPEKTAATYRSVLEKSR